MFAVTYPYKGIILGGAFDQCQIYAYNQCKVGIFASMLVTVFFTNSFISYDRPIVQLDFVIGSFTCHVTFANFKKYMKMKMMIPVIKIFSSA